MEHVGVNQSDLDGDDFSSDDDYSPGSLVIDTQGGDSSLNSTPHNSFPDVSTSHIDPTAYSTDSFLSPIPYIGPPPHPILTESTPSQPVQVTSHPSTQSQLNPLGRGGGVGMSVPVVTLGQRVPVASKEGTPSVDTLCVYYYHWRDVQLDILVTNNHPTYIPIKNVYQRAIPCLKQNVLSARISKHGIRSAVLPEPYVSTLKRLDLGLTGSSHYITIQDFFKICRYFKYQPPDDLFHFRLVNSTVSPEDVLEIFNNPESENGRQLLERLVGSEGVGGGRSSDNSSPAMTSLDEGEGSIDEGIAEVDGRRLTLPGGRTIILLIKGGIPFIPNPELAKILPNVTRTAMEVIRNTYGIIVEQSSKNEINLMKHLGIVSPKAGRTLLYKVSDVAKMYPHWKLIIPDYITDLCAGKIPEDKIDVSVTPRLTDSPYHTHTPSPLTSSHTSRPKRKNWRKSNKAKVSAEGHMTAWAGKVEPESSVYVGSGVQQPVWVAGPDGQPVPLHQPPPTHRTPSNLTPEWFQQPVKLLNSIQQALSTTSDYPVSGHMTEITDHMASSSSHVTIPSSHVTDATNFMSPTGTKVRGLKGKRRNSSTSGPPLDDTDLEYSDLSWGDHTLSLLCSSDDQPYLPVPELVAKIFHDRSYLSPQRRNMLGVVTLSATSLQIHALRARGSLGNYTGNVKLVSLSDAVKVAVNANIQIPGSVIQTLQAYSSFLPEPIQHLLSPVTSYPTPPPPSQEAHSSQPTHPTRQETLSQEMSYIQPPTHPDVIDLGRMYHLGDSLLCQVKWEELKLVVYIKCKGEFYMGLYQVYEDLFKKYVTRVNFKMRMRKLHIRSIRAAPIVRVKLIEIGALPSHCPVCGLILVSQVESLAKSYGLIPPSVIYEVFLSQATKMAPPISQPKLGRPRKVAIHRREKPNPSPVVPGPSQQQEQQQHGRKEQQQHGRKEQQQHGRKEQQQHGRKEHNVFMYEFSNTPNQSYPTMNIVSHPRPGDHLIGRSDNDKLVSPVYGVVPYLTSSHESLGEPPKNLLMTSSPPVATDELIPSSTTSGPLVVSISRSLTSFSHPQTNSGFNPLATSSSAASHAPSVNLGGSRRKVLQNLAKKIAQKSRKFTSSLASNSFQDSQYQPPDASDTFDGQHSAFNMPEGTSNRLCVSCGRMNPHNKKRCMYCSNFIMGRTCPNCGSLSHNRAKSCTQCKTSMPYTLKREKSNTHSVDHTNTSLPHSLITTTLSANVDDPSKVDVVSRSPSSSSPTSPKFSAPPIRSAVLKNLFPQDSRRPESADQPTASTAAAVAAGGGNGQLHTKTMFLGNLSSSRKCPECGQLNTKMAKKCIQCRSHLQGRACTRCGRPNLSIVSDCHKCGAPLPSPTPTAKWAYRGGRSGREYKTVQRQEEKILQSRAPISCIRCNKIRMSNYFKCGRCGDVFKTRPLVDKPPETKDEGEELESTNHKRRKMSHDTLDGNGILSAPSIEPSVLQVFANNILILDMSEELTPLFISREENCRSKIPEAEEELEAAESEYQAYLQKKNLLETSYQNLESELNGLIREVERHTSLLQQTEVAVKEAQEMVDTLPEQINKLKEKLDKIDDIRLLLSENREM